MHISNVHSKDHTAIAFDRSAMGRAAPVSTKMLWIGRSSSVLAVPFLIFDGMIKVLQVAPAVEATLQLGYPERLVLVIGLLELACLAVYAIPRTSVLGAIVLTGYLGGAIVTYVRIGSDPFPVVFPVMFGVLLWGGLYLRDKRLRTLISFRNEPAQQLDLLQLRHSFPATSAALSVRTGCRSPMVRERWSRS